MKLLNKQGQTTHKFSFLTAEQKPWQTLSDFMWPVFTVLVCSKGSTENNAMTWR